VVLPHTGGLVESILKRLPLPTKFRDIFLRLASQVLEGLRAFHDWGRLAGFVALTVVIWSSDCLGVVLGAHALGLEISFPVALLLLTALGLGSALPSTPGYVGIYQFVAVTVLSPFGISKDAALAFILVQQALGYVVVTALGLPGLYRVRKQ
jgi:glycosyltransferase 2 family protein